MNWNSIKQQARKTSEAAFTSMTVLSNEITSHISSTDWAKSINTYRSEISSAMDEKWNLFTQEGIGKTMSASNHRILDGGHDFFSTIDSAQKIGEQNGWNSIETFQKWANSYFTDLSSSAGMPVFGKLSDEIYSFLRSMGLDEASARDFVTVNGQEACESVISGSITAVALIFSWKSEDKIAFSKCIGGILCSGTVTMNPAMLVVAVIALAFGYNKLMCKETAARGAITSGVGLLIGAIIPGPVLLGLVPAVIASIYVSKKMGTEFKPIEFSGKMFDLLRSEEFKKTCMGIYAELNSKVSNLGQKEAKSA